MFMQRYESQVYAVFRIVMGFLFLFHGSEKLFSFPAWERPEQMPQALALFSGGIEFFGGLMIMLGFMAGWAGFVCSGLMAGAYWMAHGTQALLPIQNHGELAAVYCFVFLLISAKGSGIWSIDAARGA